MDGLNHPTPETWAWLQTDMPDSLKSLLTQEAERLRAADERLAAAFAANAIRAERGVVLAACSLCEDHDAGDLTTFPTSVRSASPRPGDEWPAWVRVTYDASAVGLYPVTVVFRHSVATRTKPDVPYTPDASSFVVERPTGETRHATLVAAIASAARYCPTPF